MQLQPRVRAGTVWGTHALDGQGLEQMETGKLLQKDCHFWVPSQTPPRGLCVLNIQRAQTHFGDRP